ncbi:receptor-interacting serine/threonine-protein kinase 3-like [Chanos chanos]|uniref:Receptor-interacting serine/threonine-protein kinase 3-like n=1 Tax=Chanos chanos TaxID=29144 RepID=A0A6J2VQR2_CHACN|nr:receptor-interacting serine/threonine-protein kinase 3-like [Chanos chanos]
MELSSYPQPALIHNDRLTSWEDIDSGGFGQIFKAKHVEWGLDVAIKLLHSDNESSKSILREAEMMKQGGHPHVLRILGIYEGQPPKRWSSSQLGLVMEFMERGSLKSLLNKLEGPPPWPLVFRLAHQIALGMNYLHCLSPPLLHLDLKPSNVLLDDSLSAKLTDFGLAKVVRSVSKAMGDDGWEEGGTLEYMPPEAFTESLGSYKPSCASDVYSYGILLWSICTGKEPYSNVLSSMVRFHIPRGDRPSLTDRSLDCSKVVGLQGLKDLMGKCWHQDPKARPSFRGCLEVTEVAYEQNKPGVSDAVHMVHKILDSKRGSSGMEQNFEKLHISPPQPQNGGIYINMSSVTGLQIGNDNYMSITGRQRHPTAPPSVNASNKQPETLKRTFNA